jgi:hypothetical protein
LLLTPSRIIAPTNDQRQALFTECLRSDPACQRRTPARFMGCPLDAIWEWHYRHTGYLRRGYEWLREERRRAA